MPTSRLPLTRPLARQVLPIAEQGDVAAVGRLLRATVEGDFSTADLSAFTADGAGAVERTIADKLGETVSVKNFGAVGDGVADDAAAIQAADDSLGDGGKLFFPIGTYLVKSGVEKNPYTTWIGEREGASGNSSQIKLGFNGIAVSMTSPGGTIFCEGSGFRDLGFVGNRSLYPAGQAIDIGASIRQIQFSNVSIHQFQIGVNGGGNAEVIMQDVFIFQCKWNLQGRFADSEFINCEVGSGYADTSITGGAGLYLLNASNCRFSQCRFQVNRGGFGAWINWSSKLAFVDCTFDQNEQEAVIAYYSTDLDFVACRFFDNGKIATPQEQVRFIGGMFEFTAATSDVCTLSGASPLGDPVNGAKVRVETTGTLPAGLAADTTYFFKKLSSTTFSLTESSAAATGFWQSTEAAPTAVVDITDAGTGTHYLTPEMGGVRFFGGSFEDRQLGTAFERVSHAVNYGTQGDGDGVGYLSNYTFIGVDFSRVPTVFNNTSRVTGTLRYVACAGLADA